MGLSIRKHQVAEIDIVDQARYIATHSLDAACRFFDAVETTIQFLRDSPEVGGVCAVSNPQLAGLRQWRVRGFRNHIIFYLVNGDTLEIVRVLHGARDIESLLSSRP